MENNKFDSEYYIMSVDGANHHPVLTWGETNHRPFIFPKPISNDEIVLPLKIEFAPPYLKEIEMADILFLYGDLAMSEKVKSLFEKMDIYGVQFFPAEIATNKNDIIKGYYVFHSWNRIAAVDKSNYIGSPVTDKGRIDSLQQFSLDKDVLNAIPLEKRLSFHLAESKTERLIHKNIYEAFMQKDLTGFSFIKVSEWRNNI